MTDLFLSRSTLHTTRSRDVLSWSTIVYGGNGYQLHDRILYFDADRDPIVAVNSEYYLDCLAMFSVDVWALDQDQAVETLIGLMRF